MGRLIYLPLIDQIDTGHKPATALMQAIKRGRVFLSEGDEGRMLAYKRASVTYQIS